MHTHTHILTHAHPHTCTSHSHTCTIVHCHMSSHMHTHTHTCTPSQTPRVLYAIVLFDPLAADFNIDGVLLVMYNGQQRPLSGQGALQAVGTQINQKISPPDRVHVKVRHLHMYRISSIRCRGYYTCIFFIARFCVTTIRGRRLFLWKACQHQQRLDKVHTGDTVTTVRCCQH